MAARSKPLGEYARRRDFRSTPEPGARPAPPHPKPIFVIQKHDATRLHYDFRLEIGGVLESWAVPKGPSLDPGDKRLAVHVEDHPLEYANFEGVIPDGQYGGGPVIVWDKGEWTPEASTDPAAALERGKLSFTLRGEKLRGGWTLTRIGSSNGEHRENWLLIKRKDRHASIGADSIVDREPTSVLTGRTIETVAASDGRATAAATEAIDASSVTRARRVPRIPEYRPQLCTLAANAPSGEGWLHEIKLDGYRLLARRTAKGVRLDTRTGKDWTARFPPIADAVAALGCESCVLDGEATIVDDDGRTSFQQLQNAIKARRFDRLVYFVFDLLYIDGHDLTRSPLIERKAALEALFAGAPHALRLSEYLEGDGSDVLSNACDLGLEGIVSKRADAAYEQSRSRSWLKIKCTKRQEFVVVGWTPPSGSRKHFGSLLLAAHDDEGRLVYTGKVGTGFTSRTLKDMAARMASLERKTSPLEGLPEPAERKGARWITPRLVAEIEFTEWTQDGRLRHPSFQGLREDKPPKDVRIETAPEPAPLKESPRVAKSKNTVVVAGVTLTSPDRVLFPDQGLTKRDLAEYYESVADRMLPFLRGRPLSTVRCPKGRGGTCFFQKHIRESFGDAVAPISVREKGGVADYISVDTRKGLVTLVQFGVLEIHPWGSTQEHLERPDMLTFDLDPGDGAPFEMVKEGARTMHDILQNVGLRSFLKTTGGKGLHVVVPMRPGVEWERAKEFCAAVANDLTRREPDRYVAKSSKAARKGKIFIDYLRNSRGATSVAPYSTRARPGAPVATPLRWDELSRLDSPAKYTVRNVTRRLSRLKDDPWAGYAGVDQRLEPAADPRR
ncbi:MAG: DNA ligase D [Phycisphaerales bacterium]